MANDELSELAEAGPTLPGNPFRLGVASGEPTSNSVVLWTRLAPDPYKPGHGLPVECDTRYEVKWEIFEANDSSALYYGIVEAQQTGGYAIHVEVDGLEPRTKYRYRFSCEDGRYTVEGETKTLPHPDDMLSDEFRIAFCSCQNYQNGFFGAHAGIALDEPDLIVFLGDYIYEKPNERDDDRWVRPHPATVAERLDDYRLRYAWYKSDSDLQAAHAAAPWVVIWDDHEVQNNYIGGRGPLPGPQFEHLEDVPEDAATEASEAAVDFPTRRKEAYQAFYENMPLRRDQKPDASGAMVLHRQLAIGRMANLYLLDTRQHRTLPSCHDKVKDGRIQRGCSDEDASMLGSAQAQWLLDALKAAKHDPRAPWNILAQPYVFATSKKGGADGTWSVSADGWDAYDYERRRIKKRLKAARNPIVIGGDIHRFLAGVMQYGGDLLAPEFVGGAISSPSRASAGTMAKYVRENPRFKLFANNTQQGYGLIDITTNECRVTFRTVGAAKVRRRYVEDLKAFLVRRRSPEVCELELPTGRNRKTLPERAS